MPAVIDGDAVAAIIRTERDRRGWSQQQLAEAADVSRRTIAVAENNEHNLHGNTYVKIARALGISIARLLGEGDPPP